MIADLFEIEKKLADHKIRLRVCKKPTPEDIEKTMDAIFGTGVLPERYDVEACKSLEELVEFCQEYKVDVVFAESEEQGWCLKGYWGNVCRAVSVVFPGNLDLMMR